MTVFDADPMDGGFSVAGWLRLWDACNTTGVNGPQRVAWPDGGSLLDQPSIAVDMFDLIDGAVDSYSKNMRARQSGR